MTGAAVSDSFRGGAIKFPSSERHTMEIASQLTRARRQLDEVQDRIASHALNAPEMLEARSVAKEYADEGRSEADAELSRRGLPSLSSQTRALFRGLASLARLNRTRLRLETRIQVLEGQQGGV